MEFEIVQRAIRGDHQAILSLIEMDDISAITSIRLEKTLNWIFHCNKV